MLQIRDCKRIGQILGVAPTKARDALHDALCKVALLLESDLVLGHELLAEATRHVRDCRETGASWRLRDQREAMLSPEAIDLLERMAAGRADRAEIGQRSARCGDPR